MEITSTLAPFQTYDLSDLGLDEIARSQLIGDQLRLIYAPPNVPEDRESFEEAMMKCLQQSSNVKEVQIGHPDWLEQKPFCMSFRFCKTLMERAEQLILNGCKLGEN